MKLRALCLAALLLGLLPATAWADEGHGRGAPTWISDFGQQSARSTASFIRLASGRAPVGSSDPNVVVARPDGGSQQATVCSATPNPGWAGPLLGSRWISTLGDCTSGILPGNYTYTTSFTLPSNVGSLHLQGSVLVDDTVIVYLNGNQIFSGGGLAQPAAFASDNSGYFQAGTTNTLTFVVNNIGSNDNPSGLDFVAAVNTGATVPVAPLGNTGFKNHGQCVAQYAHAHARGPQHGSSVSEAAHQCPPEGGD